ncbi:MAG: transketolase [Gammaproteobacteria bacterium]|jgi:transketolase
MVSLDVLANALRFLSIDAVEKAQSGHPGMPMGMADIATVLWREFLQHNPNNPNWPNRDRFILSNGHGSMLQYSLLHLTGYDLTLEDLKQFRQVGSKTPGHPEHGLTPGIETTTGPLGQGLANAVGMALAERKLAAEFNRDDLTLIDHYTYVFAGDGCLMEGVSHEACSFAGAQRLGKLIAFWDDNGISIDGKVNDWCIDNVPERFRAYQWHVIADVDGHDPDAIRKAIKAAQLETEKPTLICCRTQIGFGAPNLSNTAKVHGAPMGKDEVTLTREKLNWPYAPFEIPEDIYKNWDAKVVGRDRQSEWDSVFAKYKQAYPELAQEFTRRLKGELPKDFAEKQNDWIESLQQAMTANATRQASQVAITHYAAQLPELIGGSADLTESNLTHWKGAEMLSHLNPGGEYIFYGVREFAMVAIMNGIALYGGLIPFGGTFLVFTDYARNAIRMAALMEQKVILVGTHDSIGLGEDGPTHQPIEQLSSLRLIPHMSLWRPCDGIETAIAWRHALMRKGPTILALSRQKLPAQTRDKQMLQHIEKGGYILWDSPKIQAIIIATGSEVQLAMTAAQQLAEKNIAVRVVSMPSTNVFDQQTLEYREQVLPKHIKKRVAVEAGSTHLWAYYVGTEGKVVGIDRFGESGPAEKVFQALHMTVQNVVKTVEEVICQ